MECSTRWERWNHPCTNALCVLLHHRSKPQPGSLQALPLGSIHWFWGLAVWSLQPTASCKVWNAQRPLQMFVGHRFKGIFQDKNRGTPHLFRFHYRDIHTTNPQISCACLATGLQLLEQII